MTKSSDRFPPVPTGSGNRSSSRFATGSDRFPSPGADPRRDGNGGNQSQSNGEPDTWKWQPPTAELAPRLHPAWKALLEHLADGQWHPRRTTIDTMLAASDILPKTATNLIAQAAKLGLIERRRRANHREDRLVEPPGTPNKPDAPTNTGTGR